MCLTKKFRKAKTYSFPIPIGHCQKIRVSEKRSLLDNFEHHCLENGVLREWQLYLLFWKVRLERINVGFGKFLSQIHSVMHLALKIFI